MFSKALVLAATAGIALFGAGGALADDITEAPEMAQFKSGKTRAEVAAETIEAAQRGLIARNDADLQRIAGMGFAPSKSRAQVAAETREATRLGLTRYGEGEVPAATAEQLELIHLAGQRALQSSSVVVMK